MIRPDQVWLAIEAVDMRMGIDGLSLKIQQALGRSPCDEMCIRDSHCNICARSCCGTKAETA